jgi:hypothetical protein
MSTSRDLSSYGLALIETFCMHVEPRVGHAQQAETALFHGQPAGANENL